MEVMYSSNVVERSKLKEERKIRKLEKKNKKQKQRELQIQDQRANKLTISNDCFENYQLNTSPSKTSRNTLNINLTDVIQSKNIKQFVNVCEVASQNENKIKKSTELIRSENVLHNIKNDCVTSTIQNSKNQANNNPFSNCRVKAKLKNEKTIYVGNKLDSSLPVRSVGKHSDLPKHKYNTKLKQTILNETCGYSSIKLINYSTNIINNELENKLEAFLMEVVAMQEKLFKRDPLKGDIKRRYIVGFHQLKKYLLMKRIKIFVIAKDIKINTNNDILMKTIQEITNLADMHKVPYIFSLKRRKLGAITLKYLPVSCMGLINYDLANYESCTGLLSAIEDSKTAKAKEDSDVINGDFLKKLKDVMCFI